VVTEADSVVEMVPGSVVVTEAGSVEEKVVEMVVEMVVQV
jgi:hypothetical protein